MFVGRGGYILPFNNEREHEYGNLIYLTWTSDPLTTMTIQWHTINIDNPNQTVLYRKEGTLTWQNETGTVRNMPVTNKKRKIHWTTLRNLEPNTGYEFTFEGSDFQHIYKFKTMPENLNNHPIKIATSSDSHNHYSADWFIPMTNIMGGSVENGVDADIIVGVGDFTYDDGNVGQKYTDEWIDLLKHFQNAFVDKDGYIIPMVQTVGNHDTLYQQHRISAPGNAPNFEALFAFPTQDDYPTQQQFYGTLKFADYLQIILIDSPWGAPEEEIKPWLEEVVDNEIKHIIPFVHYQFYRYRDGVEGAYHPFINKWEQIFLNANVKAVFDGHDHIYKRTHPIINGLYDEDGIIHFGSGTWQDVRTHLNLGTDGLPIEPTTFIADYGFNNINEDKAKHFHLITLTNESIKVQAVSDKGNINHTTERTLN